MSARSDYEDLSQFLACQDPSCAKTILVHGEYDVQYQFRMRLLKKGFLDIEIPQLHEEIKLG